MSSATWLTLIVVLLLAGGIGYGVWLARQTPVQAATTPTVADAPLPEGRIRMVLMDPYERTVHSVVTKRFTEPPKEWTRQHGRVVVKYAFQRTKRQSHIYRQVT